MPSISEYVNQLQEAEKAIILHMYGVAQHTAPQATEGVSYGMPALVYKGKGVIAIMVTKKFLSLYPFSAVERLGVDASAFEQTSGSIHFSADKPLPDDLLRQIVSARLKQIDATP